MRKASYGPLGGSGLVNKSHKLHDVSKAQCVRCGFTCANTVAVYKDKDPKSGEYEDVCATCLEPDDIEFGNDICSEGGIEV